VVPTILEAANLPEPRIVNGTPQRPIEGGSMVYSFEEPLSPSRHQIQYFEMFGNRGIYFDGWFAGTVHIKPWGNVENRFTEDTWELYHVKEDFSMSTNLANERPDIVALMQKTFIAEAEKYKVLPMDDRRQELFNPKLAGRPDLMFGRTSLTLYEGMTGMLENDFINTKNGSFEIVADIEAGDKTTNGVIISQAGRFGGWSFYVNNGTLTYLYNYVGIDQYKVTSSAKLPKGKSTVKMDFAYEGGDKPGQGGTATLYINGKSVGSGRIEHTQFSIFSADESANVGLDSETPVSNEYDVESSKFNGTIDKVVITLK
jgi:arylsulfatase